MFRFEGPILHPVLASALYACVRQPPHEGPPLVSYGEHAGESCRGDAPVLRSP